MLVDTHCHLDFPEFSNDLDDVLKRAERSGVKYIINIASSLEGSKNSVKLASKIDYVFASLGIHPHHADQVKEGDLKTIEEMFVSGKKIVALGEVGLDFYRNLSSHDAQKSLFAAFLNLKNRLNLPIVVHSRNAANETLDMLKAELARPIDGVMHCFSQDRDYLKKVLDIGMHVSFTCNLTFDNALRLREVARFTPLDRLLLETDAPFLAPQRFRGKRNEPAYLVHLVDILENILNISRDEIEEKTTDNADKLFKLGIKKCQ